MKYLRIFTAVLKKEFIIWRRYWFNSLGGLITLYFVFVLIFLGYSGLAAGTSGFDDTLESLIAGYLLWVFALLTYQEISYQTRQEAQEGTLEQLYMSPFGYPFLTGLRLIANFFIHIFFVGILLGAIILTTGRSLNLDLVSLLPLLVLTLVGIAGIGFLLGGLALVFKRIQSYLQIIQFALVGLIAAPVGRIEFFRLLPASLGASLIREVLVYDSHLLEIAGRDLLGLGINSLLYLLLGYLVFKACERYAMKQGLLGHY